MVGNMQKRLQRDFTAKGKVLTWCDGVVGIVNWCGKIQLHLNLFSVLQLERYYQLKVTRKTFLMVKGTFVHQSYFFLGKRWRRACVKRPEDFSLFQKYDDSDSYLMSWTFWAVTLSCVLSWNSFRFLAPLLCQLRAHIYQARNLLPSDPNGLAGRIQLFANFKTPNQGCTSLKQRSQN